MKDKLKRIINHYGINAQQRQFAEEVFELQAAIIIKEKDEYRCSTDVDECNKNDVAEEIADCMVMLNQFKEYYNITDEQINKQIEYKVNRQIKRIEKETKGE